MADSAVAITAGTGTNVDTRTESTNGNHRQVVVLGDPATNAGVAPVDATKGLAVDLSATGANSNAILATLATQPVIASGNLGIIGGSLSAFQGGSWLVSVATLPVLAEVINSSIPVTQSGTWDEVGINDSGNSITIDGNVGNIGGSLSAFQGGAWTVQPGNTPNTTAWLVTMATMPVVGEFSISDVGIAGGSISAFNAGGSLSAFQGGSWLVSVATLPVVATVLNSTIAVTQSGTWDEVGINDSGNSITIDGNVGVIGGSLTVYQGSPFWQVTMATLPVVGDFSLSGEVGVAGGSISAFNAGGSLTAFQGGNWLVSVATLPVVATVLNSTLAVTQSGTWDEVGINDSGNSITVDGNVGVIGGSLSVWNAGGSISVFQGTPFWQVTMATLPVVGEFSVAGQATVTALQGDAGSSSWLVTMATLPVIANVVNTITADVTGQGDVPITLAGEAVVLGAGTAAFGKLAANSGVDIGDVDIASIAAGDNNIGNVDAIQSGTWTVQPGNTPNSTAWLVTMATLPVVATILNSTIAVTQSGTWDEIGINDSGNSITIDGNVGNIGGSLSAYVYGGSLSAFNAGGSLSAFQGGTWNVFSSMASGTNFIAGGQYLPTLASLSSLQHTNLKTDMFSNLMVNVNVPIPNSTKINRFYTLASMASLMATPGAGRRLVVRELDFSANATVTVKLVEDQGGTPATVWGPHYFLPYAGVTKTQSYIPLTANKSLGLDIQPGGFNAGIDVRVETENV